MTIRLMLADDARESVERLLARPLCFVALARHRSSALTVSVMNGAGSLELTRDAVVGERIPSVSAKGKAYRAEFNAMLDAIRQGGVDVVVAWGA